MKKTKMKKLAASFAICGLCIATAVFSVLAVMQAPSTIKGMKTYAGGFVHVNTEIDGNSIDAGITELTENFFNPNKGYNSDEKLELIPGSTHSGSITFKNNSSDCKVGIYFWAQSTPEEMENGDKPYEIFEDKLSTGSPDDYTASQLKDASDKLVSEYLDLEIFDPSGQSVYSGKLNGPERSMFVGSIGEGESVTYTFTLKVSTDLESFARSDSYEAQKGLEHGYENTVALIDWYFGLSIIQAPTQTMTTTTTTTTTTTKKATPISPKTGEAPNMYLFAAIACGVSALVIFYVTFCGGKRRKREEE